MSIDAIKPATISADYTNSNSIQSVKPEIRMKDESQGMVQEVNRRTAAVPNDITTREADKEDNVLKNAPHTALEVAGDEWNHKYSRSEAAYPLDWIKDNKFWPHVSRVDNGYGDRNLICTCQDWL